MTKRPDRSKHCGAMNNDNSRNVSSALPGAWPTTPPPARVLPSNREPPLHGSDQDVTRGAEHPPFIIPPATALSRRAHGIIGFDEPHPRSKHLPPVEIARPSTPVTHASRSVDVDFLGQLKSSREHIENFNMEVLGSRDFEQRVTSLLEQAKTEWEAECTGYEQYREHVAVIIDFMERNSNMSLNRYENLK